MCISLSLLSIHIAQDRSLLHVCRFVKVFTFCPPVHIHSSKFFATYAACPKVLGLVESTEVYAWRTPAVYQRWISSCCYSSGYYLSQSSKLQVLFYKSLLVQTVGSYLSDVVASLSLAVHDMTVLLDPHSKRNHS